MRGEWRRCPSHVNDRNDLDFEHKTIYLPPFTLYQGADKTLVCDYAQTCPLPKTEPKRCLITQLPFEILLQITRYLVPSAATFHVYPISDRYPSTTLQTDGIPATVVHKFSKEPLDVEDRLNRNFVYSPAGVHLTALARTCRILSEAYHTGLYGGNRFIFELPSHGVVNPQPYVVGPPEAEPPVESWARLFEGKSGVLWPLSERTASYVRDLTFIVTLQRTEESWAKAELTDRVQRVVQALNPLHNITSLTIDIRTEPRLNAKPTTFPFVLQFAPEQRLSWSVRGHSPILGVREMSTLPEACTAIRSMWFAFGDLRGIRDVELSGDVDAELAQELTAVMRSRPTELKSIQGECPRWTMLKRRQTSELQRQAKRRRIN